MESIPTAQAHDDGAVPYFDDAFDRKKFADALTGYIKSFREGAVIAIDAPWGEGKTWFGKNWYAALKCEGYKAIYFDAFAYDYCDDPFIPLVSSFSHILNEGEMAKVKLSAMEIGRRVIGPVTYAALGALMPVMGEAAKAIEKAVNEYFSERFEEFKKDAELVSSFKERIRASIAGDKPAIIFIDELDRCKPTFALSLVERLKHFFDVPNLVFVLLINRQQLESYVKGMYGGDVDAAIYLEKFVNFTFGLPKNVSMDGYGISHPQRYINHIMEKYNLSGRKDIISRFSDHLDFLACTFHLSLRDLDKAFSYYVLAGDFNKSPEIYAFLIALKCKYLEEFCGFSNRDPAKFSALDGMILRALMEAEMKSAVQWQIDYLTMLHVITKNYLDKGLNEVPVGNSYERLIYNGGVDQISSILKKLSIDIG